MKQVVLLRVVFLTSCIMSITFRGELEGISDLQLEYIKNVLQDRGFKNAEAVISSVGKQGDNYVASVKRITIENGNETFKMVGKIAPHSEMARAMSNTAMLFKNEHIMYTQILPKLDELQKSAGVSESEFYRFPACYGSLTEPMHEVILLEDLNALNFAILDRFKSLSDESIRLALKNFAILHSLSYALKKLEPETYKIMKSDLFSMWEQLSQTPETEQAFVQLETSTMEIVTEEKYKRVLKNSVRQGIALAAKHLKTDVDGKHSVIQQGDSWTNNIMYRLEGEKPVESIFIDYQLSVESSPAYDLHYMIFNCTDYELRKKHFHDWIDYYHAELDKSLHNFGLKANFVYPKDQLDADLKRYGKAMLGLSVLLASVLIRKSEDALIVSETQSSDEMAGALKVTSLDMTSIMIYKKRIEGLIDSLLEFGLL